MDLRTEFEIVLKILLAFLAGGFIGLDRERHGLDAGMRTYAAVCLGATLFTTLGEQLQDTAAVSRIISNIIVGIGFLGAGIIYKGQTTSTSKGLTSAATIWCTAAVGISIGLDKYIIACAASLALYFLLSLHHQRWYIRLKSKIMIQDEPQSKIN